MLRKTPPLAAAEAFLAAADAKSFKAAAEELALSPSAFSRRIQMLERFVEAQLFDRSGAQIVLTEKGQAYREAIEPALQSIRSATASLKQGNRTEPLRVSASQSFAIDWLMPRLSRFKSQFDLNVELIVAPGARPLRTGEADLAIVGGSAEDFDFNSERLVALEGVMVGAPDMASQAAEAFKNHSLHDFKLLGLRTPGNLWQEWLAQSGSPAPQASSVTLYDSGHLLYEAAANGFGLALAVPLAAERFLRDGRLVACAPQRHRIGAEYRLVYRNEDVDGRRATNLFKVWLHEEVQLSIQYFRGATNVAPSHVPLN